MLSLANAEEFCKTDGGGLISLNTQMKNSFFANVLLESTITFQQRWFFRITFLQKFKDFVKKTLQDISLVFCENILFKLRQVFAVQYSDSFLLIYFGCFCQRHLIYALPTIDLNM